ncbi:MAG: extracellular solute-binding protein, partial [Gemmatimonadaceae bacterium]|nr:extracellular solute-binding protein [Gemmatimonadaceae bacterium]
MDSRALIVRAIAGAGLTLALGACAESPASDAVTLRLWAMGREGEVVSELMPAFEREHPGIRVEVQQIPWTAAHEKLLTAFVGEATPDIAMLGNTWLPEFVALDALAPLDTLIAASDGIDPRNFFDGIWRTNVVDGETYGIPWYVDTRLVYYRSDILARAGYSELPQTWAGWMAAMRKIKSQMGPSQYPMLMPTNEWPQLVGFALETGSPILSRGGRFGAFQEPRFREAFEFYLSFFREGLAPPVS